MSKKNEVDWKTTVDALDDLTDEEIDRASKILNPSGKSAGEEVEEALEKIQKHGVV